MNRETIFSPDRAYRYTLWRTFETGLLPAPVISGGNVAKEGYVQFIGLNPSTADETQDDPTIRRCIDFSKRWGYGAFCMTNIFGFRATDPKDMFAHQESSEARIENAKHVERIAESAGLIICAWGKHGEHLKRGEKFIEHLSHIRGFTLHHLGLNGDGSPKHPLYLKAATQPTVLT